MAKTQWSSNVLFVALIFPVATPTTRTRSPCATNSRDEIEAIMVDCYDEDEQMSVWEVTFFGDVEVPIRATLLGMPVVVTAFRINDANAVQCQANREDKQRWVGVDDLDEEGLPTDMLRVVPLCHLVRNTVHAVAIPIVSRVDD